MGYVRFRRSVGLGRLARLNFGKRGVSVTLGRRRGGPHVTAHTSGRVTGSVGLPGTGLSYVATTRRRVPRTITTAGRWVALVVIGLVVLGVVLAALG